MKLSDIPTRPIQRVLGLDCSTKSLAFGIFDNQKPAGCGEIFFKGETLWERLKDAHYKVPLLVREGIFRADVVVFEGAILVGNNAKVGISLAYMYGACIASLMQEGMKVQTVAPLTWQSYIGNPNLKPFEKAVLKSENPGKSASWYQSAGREMRKQKSLKFARQFFDIHTGSDNVGDACSIAWYGMKTLTEKR